MKRETEPQIGQLSSRRIYTGKVVSLDVDTVRFPNGSTGELEMIRHPGASAVVPFLEMPTCGSKVLLIRQYRYAANGYVTKFQQVDWMKGKLRKRARDRELQGRNGYISGRRFCR